MRFRLQFSRTSYVMLYHFYHFKILITVVGNVPTPPHSTFQSCDSHILGAKTAKVLNSKIKCAFVLLRNIMSRIRCGKMSNAGGSVH